MSVLQKQAPAGITVTNLHNDYAVLAVQGPMAPKVLEALGISTDIDYMAFAHVSIAGADVILCRTGYTGELGYELLPHAKDAIAVWDALVKAIAPLDGLICGLGARDTLRTEMGYPLHGQDLSRSISPVEAGAGWAVGWGLGMERLLLLLQEVGASSPSVAPDAYAVVMAGAPMAQVLQTLENLRDAGVCVQQHPLGKDGPPSVKSQFKKADASGARFALVFGPDELAQGQVTIKPLRDGGQQVAQDLSSLTTWADDLKAATQS